MLTTVLAIVLRPKMSGVVHHVLSVGGILGHSRECAYARDARLRSLMSSPPSVYPTTLAFHGYFVRDMHRPKYLLTACII